METREHDESATPEASGETGSNPEVVDSDGAAAADAGSVMPTLPPRVEPAPVPRLDRPLEVEERLVSLDQLDEDATFQLRPPGDTGRLAMDLARLGQAFPVDVRPVPGSDR